MGSWFQVKMGLFEIAIFSALLLQSNASPSCTYYSEEKTNLVCSSDGSDFVLKKGLVSDQEKVVYLSLQGCKIIEIQCDAFSGLPALRHLNIAGNKLHELKSCTLNNLRKLNSLNISLNQLSVLPSEAFSNLSDLEELNLNGNELKTLESGIFNNLIKLNKLDLSNNAIDGKNLSPHVFDNNKIITTLDLSRNDMSAAPEDLLQSFQILESLYLDRCYLVKIPSFATKINLKSLKNLILSTNQSGVSSLDDPTTFINLDNLETLNFAGNAIDNIVDNIFTPLRKLKTIVLKHNYLKKLSDKLFQNMPKLVNIDLSYNQIEVIDTASFRHSPMKNLNLSGNKLTYLPENFYETLASSGGKLKKFLFSNNPWNCACLRDILQEVKRYNIEYNSTVYDGNTPVCEVTDDFMSCKRG